MIINLRSLKVSSKINAAQTVFSPNGPGKREGDCNESLREEHSVPPFYLSAMLTYLADFFVLLHDAKGQFQWDVYCIFLSLFFFSIPLPFLFIRQRREPKCVK